MELGDAIGRRRMVRNFGDRPVPTEVVDRLCDLARRAPSAGNTAATRFLVLDDPEATARYWDVSLPEPRRSGFRWPGLLRAPVLVIVTVEPDAYVRRYGEADKANTGLGGGADRWPVPYWWVDAGAAAGHLLLAAVDEGLGACLFGAFDHEPSLREAFDVPGDVRLVATIAIGHPEPDEPGRSAGRPRPPLDEVIHRGRWRAPVDGASAHRAR